MEMLRIGLFIRSSWRRRCPRSIGRRARRSIGSDLPQVAEQRRLHVERLGDGELLQLRRGLQTGHDLALQGRENGESGVAVVVEEGDVIGLAHAHVAFVL